MSNLTRGNWNKILEIFLAYFGTSLHRAHSPFWGVQGLKVLCMYDCGLEEGINFKSEPLIDGRHNHASAFFQMRDVNVDIGISSQVPLGGQSHISPVIWLHPNDLSSPTPARASLTFQTGNLSCILCRSHLDVHGVQNENLLVLNRYDRKLLPLLMQEHMWIKDSPSGNLPFLMTCQYFSNMQKTFSMRADTHIDCLEFKFH